MHFVARDQRRVANGVRPTLFDDSPVSTGNLKMDAITTLFAFHRLVRGFDVGTSLANNTPDVSILLGGMIDWRDGLFAS